MILENVRNVGLVNLTAFVVYPDNTISKSDLGGNLPAGFIKSFSIPSVNPDYSSISIKTECPELSVSVSCK